MDFLAITFCMESPALYLGKKFPNSSCNLDLKVISFMCGEDLHLNSSINDIFALFFFLNGYCIILTKNIDVLNS